MDRSSVSPVAGALGAEIGGVDISHERDFTIERRGRHSDDGPKALEASAAFLHRYLR